MKYSSYWMLARTVYTANRSVRRQHVLYIQPTGLSDGSMYCIYSQQACQTAACTVYTANRPVRRHCSPLAAVLCVPVFNLFVISSHVSFQPLLLHTLLLHTLLLYTTQPSVHSTWQTTQRTKCYQNSRITHYFGRPIKVLTVITGQSIGQPTCAS